MDDAPTDPSSLRALAAAVVARAVEDAQLKPKTPFDRASRDDARRFLCDDTDGRLERWTAALDVDADALRSKLRRRLSARDEAQHAADGR